MLKTSKQIILNGRSEINGEVVMTMTASIPSETGVGSINQYVQNPSLYDANKTQVRRDISEFTMFVYELEDEMANEVLPDSIDTEA